MQSAKKNDLPHAGYLRARMSLPNSSPDTNNPRRRDPPIGSHHGPKLSIGPEPIPLQRSRRLARKRHRAQRLHSRHRRVPLNKRPTTRKPRIRVPRPRIPPSYPSALRSDPDKVLSWWVYKPSIQAIGFETSSSLTLCTLGTCVFIVEQMYYFGIAPLPGGQVQAYPKNDIASYIDIFDAAVALSTHCVEEKSSPEAGWSVTGKLRSFI